MLIANYAKYSQNPELRRYLFDTGNSTLVEASPDDTYWGIGIVSVWNSVCKFFLIFTERRQRRFGSG